MASLNHTIRSFNRFELKYLITLQEAERFRHALRAYLLPDDNGETQGCYELSSLYYDSPDLRCYWEKVDGLKFRRKLRIRLYGDRVPDDDTIVYVEIKQRVDRVTQKRRVALPLCQALRFCDDREMPPFDPQDRLVIEEIQAFLWHYNLHPTCLVRYNRQALIGSAYDIGLRVTFDTAMSYQTLPLDLRGRACGMAMFPGGWTIMEIKVNERIPYWLTELVAAHNLRMVRVSKYCRSIELAHDSGSGGALSCRDGIAHLKKE